MSPKNKTNDDIKPQTTEEKNSSSLLVDFNSYIIFKNKKQLLETSIDGNVLNLLKKIRYEFFYCYFNDDKKTSDFILKHFESNNKKHSKGRGRPSVDITNIKYIILRYIKENYSNYYKEYFGYIVYILLKLTTSKLFYCYIEESKNYDEVTKQRKKIFDELYKVYSKKIEEKFKNNKKNNYKK